MKFNSFDFQEDVLQGIEAMGYEEMTPVQEMAIPPILEGHDVMGCAQTGTGKTAAFLLPVLNQIVLNTNKAKGVRALIVVPTRELALQIDQQIQGFAYFLPVTSIAVYGGNDSGNWDAQRKAITTGCDIVVATPGRLLAHMNLKYVDLSNIQHFILDEADRMLDMGFVDDIVKIAKELPKKHQTLMFSATMAVKIRELAKQLLNKPIDISIAIAKPAEGVTQAAYVCYDAQKMPLLVKICSRENLQSVVIFSSTKKNVKDVTRELRRNKIVAEEIHSDLDQNEREEVLRKFKSGQVPVLVATDIISRGIDVDNIGTVINYDVPKEPADYVHRVGRTARAQREGEAFTLINENDMRSFSFIEKLIEKEIPKLPVPEELGETPIYNKNQPSDRNNKGKRSFGGKSKSPKRGKPEAQKPITNSDPNRKRLSVTRTPKANNPE